jgi:cytochrome P450
MTGFNDLDVQADPFPYYREQLRHSPAWHEADMNLYVIGGHEEAMAALLDPDTFSNIVNHTAGQDEGFVAYRSYLAEHGAERCPTLEFTDPPIHMRYRRLLNRVFTPRQVKALMPSIESIAVSLVDTFADRGECEFVREFAVPLPGIFITEQLGLPREEYPTLRRWAEAMVSAGARPMTVDEAVHEAKIDLEAQTFLQSEFDRRRTDPGTDLISMLVAAMGEDDEPLSEPELQDLLLQLITGGFETTTSAFTTGMWRLARDPALADRLRAQRELVPQFVEESLRFDSPIHGLWRRATRDVTIGEVTIPAEATVMIQFGCANRDARAYADADDFDIERDQQTPHLAFGFGTHFCVAASLARQELAAGFELLLDRLDAIRVAVPDDELRRAPGLLFRQFEALPIRFEPRRS